MSRPNTAEAALRFFWERNNMDLSRDELQWLSSLNEQGESELLSIADVLNDAAGRIGLVGLNGIDDDALSSVLFTAASVARKAAVMSHIASEAAFRLAKQTPETPTAGVSGPAKKGGAK